MKAITIVAKIAFILLLIFIFNPCGVNSLDIIRYKSKFERNKTKFEQLVNLLKTQNLKTSYPINTNELPTEINDILQTLDISDVNTQPTNCEGKIAYEFTTSWSSATLYFTKDPCDKESTKNGYHHDNSTSNMTEIWGLGDDWYMWLDYDFI